MMRCARRWRVWLDTNPNERREPHRKTLEGVGAAAETIGFGLPGQVPINVLVGTSWRAPPAGGGQVAQLR